jgi:hypothetical protein
VAFAEHIKIHRKRGISLKRVVYVSFYRFNKV